MDRESLLPATLDIGPDIADQLEVFLYTNLSNIITSPTPAAFLTPDFQAALQSALNDVGIRHNIGLQKDLKDILDTFIIANLSIITIDITP